MILKFIVNLSTRNNKIQDTGDNNGERISPFVLPRWRQELFQLLNQSNSEAQAGVGNCFSRKSSSIQPRISSPSTIHESNLGCIVIHLHFCYEKQSLFAFQLAKVMLLKFCLCSLPSLSCSAARVSEVSSGGL